VEINVVGQAKTFKAISGLNFIVSEARITQSQEIALVVLLL
jgi:hypothetical protein